MKLLSKEGLRAYELKLASSVLLQWGHLTFRWIVNNILDENEKYDKD